MMYQKKTKQSNKDNVKDNVKDHFIGRPLDARVAEIHLKSFKTDVKMPWYENGTVINTEFRNEISKNDIECTSPRNRQNSSGIVLPLPTVGDVCNKTEILNSLNDSACEKDSLEISSPKETDIEEDSLEIGLITEDKPPRKIKNNAEDRTATYLYGASIQQANVAHTSKHLKKSTAFIIPFTTNKHSIVNNSSNNTRNEVLNKSGVQTECIFPNESTSERKHLNEAGNAIHYNIEHTETPIDMECQKKLFQDLKKVEGLTGIKSENTETTEEELHFRKTSLQDTARFYLSKPDKHFTAKSYELIKEQKSMNTLNAETFGRNNSFDEIEGGEFTINGLDTIIEVNEGDNKDGMKNENETDFSSETTSDLSSSWTESKESDEFILSEEFEGIFETFSSNRPKSFNTIAEVQGGIYETKKIKINADEELGLEGRNLKSKHKNNLLNYTEKENNSAESSLTLLIKMGIEDQDTSESKSINCNSQETTSINATKSKHEEDVSKNRHQAAAAIQSNSAKYLAASIIQRNIRRYLDGKRKESDSGFPGKQEGLPVNLESENTNKSEFQISFNSETTLKETEHLKKDYRDRYENSHEIKIEEPHVNQHNKRKNLITSKKWTNEKAAAVIQKAYKTYLGYKCKKRNTEISQAVHKYNNKLSANQCTSKKNSLVESDATPCPTSESKVNWFVGVEPIETSMELNKITQNLPEAKPLSNNYESGPGEVNINTAIILPEDSIGIQRNLQRDADPISNTYFIPRNQDSGEDGAQVNNSISETIQVVYNFLFAERRLYLESRDETNQQIIDDSKSFDYSECIETCVPFEHLQKFAETTQNEGGENHFIVEAANKLRGTDELVDNMQKRLLCRSNSFDSANEKVRRQRSFEEPVIWAMQDIQESKKSTPDTEDDKVVVKPMEIEDTRESSALSDSIIISHMSIDEDENDRLENPLKIEEAFERHFTKPLEDSELSVGTIMNDNEEEYFHSEKHTYKNKTNSCSIYLDDDTSENIRKKMMASSLTETESDASDDPISDSRATQLTDFNICTIINDTTGTSSDTESTIISTAEKAHGVDNPIPLKSDDTIDQSSEILAEENSPKKMPTSNRNYHRKRDLELRNTVARRMTFQRGDAILNDSMPDEEKLCSTNIEQQKGSIEKYVSHSKERNVPEHTSYKLKWLSMRQNSMPVQIDSEIFRVIPKHMRKRNKSADESRKTSKRLLKE
ncbi:serine-rich adhesin for platelets [Anastrepha ludens]|uniref:serine-rich adhesin for platelets n=1 Tax=Anastrepha ludens TaxID=28586 RepID=UPI0023B15494|nr:serine-rich adhesin for platelets [Anastrepha ludens]